MSVADLADSTGDVTLVRKERSLWEESFIRLMKNRVAVGSAIFILALVVISIFANFIAPFGFAEQDLLANNAVREWMLFMLPAGAENYVNFTDVFPLGADHLGRDLLSRTIYGARVSLSVAFIASGISLLVGTVYGMISGYVGGRLDAYQRMFDVETNTGVLDRRIRSAELIYLPEGQFDPRAGELTEEMLRNMVLMESQPNR